MRTAPYDNGQLASVPGAGLIKGIYIYPVELHTEVPEDYAVLPTKQNEILLFESAYRR